MAPSSSFLLSVEDLALRRGEILLFSGLNFALAPGESVEIRGANGAGKTSLLRALAGFLPLAAGKMTLGAGLAPGKDRPPISYQSHRDPLRGELSVAEHLAFWAGISRGKSADGDAALTELGIADLARRRCKTLSAGQARRAALARLSIEKRPIWLLDEPTAALDATGAASVRAFIDRHCGAGGGAIIATHLDLAIDAGRRRLILD